MNKPQFPDLPNITENTALPPFKAWVQFAIPSVFDDSLSYYELLSKIIEYLNVTNEHLTNVDENFATNNEVFVETYNKIVTWFNDLDVNEEIENKVQSILDTWAVDGTLNRLFHDMFSTEILERVSDITNTWLNTNIHEISGYVLDNSLTVENAAAPASLVGNGFKNKGVITYDRVSNRRLADGGASFVNQANSILYSYIPLDRSKNAIILYPKHVIRGYIRIDLLSGTPLSTTTFISYTNFGTSTDIQEFKEPIVYEYDNNLSENLYLAVSFSQFEEIDGVETQKDIDLIKNRDYLLFDYVDNPTTRMIYKEVDFSAETACDLLYNSFNNLIDTETGLGITHLKDMGWNTRTYIDVNSSALLRAVKQFVEYTNSKGETAYPIDIIRNHRYTFSKIHLRKTASTDINEYYIKDITTGQTAYGWCNNYSDTNITWILIPKIEPIIVDDFVGNLVDVAETYFDEAWRDRKTLVYQQRHNSSLLLHKYPFYNFNPTETRANLQDTSYNTLLSNKADMIDCTHCSDFVWILLKGIKFEYSRFVHKDDIIAWLDNLSLYIPTIPASWYEQHPILYYNQQGTEIIREEELPHIPANTKFSDMTDDQKSVFIYSCLISGWLNSDGKTLEDYCTTFVNGIATWAWYSKMPYLENSYRSQQDAQPPETTATMFQQWSVLQEAQIKYDKVIDEQDQPHIIKTLLKTNISAGDIGFTTLNPDTGAEGEGSDDYPSYVNPPLTDVGHMFFVLHVDHNNQYCEALESYPSFKAPADVPNPLPENMTSSAYNNIGIRFSRYNLADIPYFASLPIKNNLRTCYKMLELNNITLGSGYSDAISLNELLNYKLGIYTFILQGEINENDNVSMRYRFRENGDETDRTSTTRRFTSIGPNLYVCTNYLPEAIRNSTSASAISLYHTQTASTVNIERFICVKGYISTDNLDML